ncbi:unnamed protein product [Closterium sp. Yama58-4]|nr:unnamed protein product [Closterium sp. Yama58-4]
MRLPSPSLDCRFPAGGALVSCALVFRAPSCFVRPRVSCALVFRAPSCARPLYSPVPPSAHLNSHLSPLHPHRAAHHRAAPDAQVPATTEVEERPTEAVESTATEGARPLRKFKLREVREMCDGFSSKCPVLGEGSFGTVYRGSADLDGRAVDVAVKRLSAESQQGVDEWLVRRAAWGVTFKTSGGCVRLEGARPPEGCALAEVLILDRLRHANLVELLGYCKEKGECLLVYHYYANDSVETALFNRKRAGQEPFSWERRVSVAWQAAEALAYLHANDVIHRDFKPSNVLLDADWTAKLSDFGMCKEQEAGKSHVSTRVMGTLGYLDPDYMETGLLRQSSDVYAFGVFLLELITGKRAVSDTGQPLTSWVFPLLDQKKPEIDLLIDSALESSFDRDSALKIAVIAKFCIGDEELRPEMTAVAERLKKLVVS